MIPSSPPTVTTCQSPDSGIRDRCAMADDDTVFTRLSRSERCCDRSLYTLFFYGSHLLLVKHAIGINILIYFLWALGSAKDCICRPPSDHIHTIKVYTTHVHAPTEEPTRIYSCQFMASGPLLSIQGGRLRVGGQFSRLSSLVQP